MTDEEINTKIAKACGWYSWHRTENGWWTGPCDPRPQPPDYVHDLNAMHEAEETLTPKGQLEYQEYLAKDSHGVSWFKIHATARQRAEAFLKMVADKK